MFIDIWINYYMSTKCKLIMCSIALCHDNIENVSV